MSRRKPRELPLSQRPVPAQVLTRCRSPLVVILGSPAEVVNLLSSWEGERAVCYQLDLYQAGRLRDELAEMGVAAEVRTAPDLWDLPPEFQTAVYMPPRGGERELKIDMVEQSYHVLKPGGCLVVWSSYGADEFFPPLLKKIYGRAHSHALDPDAVLWSAREGERPRRRHEMTFQCRIAGGPSCRFLSRPGTFAYGRFDEGARALAEVMQIAPGDHVLDVGCGCGTNGVFAAQQAGPDGHVAFVDSNVRAIALAEHNARANGVPHFDVIASHTVEGLPEASFDVAVANPPYYANSSISRLFVERARTLLKPDGRLYVVTKQPNEMAVIIEEEFGAVEALMRRGYVILCA
jgi:16S rRNA (guanine1207-N2)-methyltransferase